MCVYVCVSTIVSAWPVSVSVHAFVYVCLCFYVYMSAAWHTLLFKATEPTIQKYYIKGDIEWKMPHLCQSRKGCV